MLVLSFLYGWGRFVGGGRERHYRTHPSAAVIDDFGSREEKS
jgi:hypothetical protein